MAVSQNDLLLCLGEMREDGRARRARGTVFAAALELLDVLPEGPARDALLEDLVAFADRACKILAGG